MNIDETKNALASMTDEERAEALRELNKAPKRGFAAQFRAGEETCGGKVYTVSKDRMVVLSPEKYAEQVEKDEAAKSSAKAAAFEAKERAKNLADAIAMAGEAQ